MNRVPIKAPAGCAACERPPPAVAENAGPGHLPQRPPERLKPLTGPARRHAVRRLPVRARHAGRSSGPLGAFEVHPRGASTFWTCAGWTCAPARLEPHPQCCALTSRVCSSPHSGQRPVVFPRRSYPQRTQCPLRRHRSRVHRRRTSSIPAPRRTMLPKLSTSTHGRTVTKGAAM